MPITRRAMVFAAPLILAGCAPQGMAPGGPALNASGAVIDPRYSAIYGAVGGEPFPVEAVDLSQLQPQFLRQEVAYQTTERPGTVVVDPNSRFLYLVQENGRALRYGVGVGRVEAFNFRGEAKIGRKAKWPRWTPTPDMIAREPQRYGPYSGGMAGGVGNPLGARALYLYKDGRDTDYRLHGTIEPWTIGTKVSSGCIRLLNQDVIDLYRRVPLGAKVVVLPAVASVAEAPAEPDNQGPPAGEYQGAPNGPPGYPAQAGSPYYQGPQGGPPGYPGQQAASPYNQGPPNGYYQGPPNGYYQGPPNGWEDDGYPRY
jgi:lipoprotein-anchoring transpeptidase ErfK/SrfK